jgi:hypothetical protein
MRRLGLVLLLSCSRDPSPSPLPTSPSKPDCTRVLDDPARTIVRMSQSDGSPELSDVVKAVRAKSGLSDVGGGSNDPHVTRTPAGCDALDRAPVVVITKDEIRVGNTHVATLAEASENGDVIDALLRALPAADAGVAILMADESTGVVVVNRVVITCKHAGYSNLLFAVGGSASAEPTRAIKL